MGVFLFSLFAYAAGMSSLIFFFYSLKFGANSIPSPFSWHVVMHNSLLFLVFPLQHSVLPRSFVKKQFGEYLHRPFYVATSGIALWIILLWWRPFGPYLYRNVADLFFDVLFYVCVLMIVLCTIELGHGKMFGLAQGIAAWKHLPLTQGELKTTGMFGIVRHPITTLLIVVLWARGSLTAGSLLFNLLFTLYALLGTFLEEKALLAEMGDEYRDYRRKVPAFIPGFSRYR